MATILKIILAVIVLCLAFLWLLGLTCWELIVEFYRLIRHPKGYVKELERVER